MSRPEGTGLSEHERRVLDEIASTLSDEDRSFARRLGAGRRALLPAWATPPWSTAVLLVAAVVGVAGGTALMLATVARSLAVATFGAAAVGAGIAALQAVAARFVRGRRARPAPGPS